MASGKSSWTSFDYAAYAATLRERLLRLLAPDGRCQNPACRKKPRRIGSLQIDHVHGRTWDLRRLNRWARARRYWREHTDGVELRALCSKCNASYRPIPLPVVSEAEAA